MWSDFLLFSVQYQVVLEREQLSFLNASHLLRGFVPCLPALIDLSKNCGLFVLARKQGMIEFKVFRRHSKESLAKAMATTMLQVQCLA